MPSDLTIRKFDQSRVYTPKPREQQVAASREKVQAYTDEDINAIVDDFVAKNRNRDKALTAAFVGGTMDIAQLVTDGLSTALVAQAPDLPYTTDYFKRQWGVADDLLAEVVGGVLSPDPAGGSKALILPLAKIKGSSKAIRGMWDEAKKLWDEGLSDIEVFRRTNVFKHPNGQPMYYRRDPGKIDIEALSKQARRQLPDIKYSEEGVVEFGIDEILVNDPQLLEMYPFLNGAKIKVHVRNIGTAEEPKFLYSNRRAAEQGLRGEADTTKGVIDLFNPVPREGDWSESMAATLYHEVGHLIDSVEGLVPTGGTTDLISGVHTSVVRSRMIKDMLENFDQVPADWKNMSQDELMWLYEMHKKHGVPITKEVMEPVTFITNNFRNASEEVRRSLINVVDTASQNESVRLAAMLQEMGESADFDSIDPRILDELSQDRYFRLEGEFRQRLNQHLTTLTEAEANAALEQFVEFGVPPSAMERPVPTSQLISEAPSKVDPRLWTDADAARFEAIDWSTEAAGGAPRFRLLPDELPEGVTEADYAAMQNVLDRDPKILNRMREVLEDTLGGKAQSLGDDAGRMAMPTKHEYPTGAKLSEEIDVYTKPSYLGSEKQYVPVIKNPTATSLRRWVDKHVPHKGDMEYDLRFAEDPDGNIYVWDAYEALHEDMEKAGLNLIEGEEDSIEAIMNWLP